MERTKRALAATLLSVAVLLLASPYAAQMVAQTIYPPAGGGSAMTQLTCTVTACVATVPFRIPNGANAEYVEVAWDTNVAYLQTVTNGGTARTLALRSAGGTVQFWAATTNSLSIDTATIYPPVGESIAIGTSNRQFTIANISRAIQGSKSKALTDNTATAFVRLAVADDDYEGCEIGYTAYAEDTATDARQVRKGSIHAAILNNGGTETVTFSTGDSAVSVTAGTFTCTFDGNSAAADTIDLRATCDTSLAATTTLTFEYRLDCPSTVTVTPQ